MAAFICNYIKIGNDEAYARQVLELLASRNQRRSDLSISQLSSMPDMRMQTHESFATGQK